MESRNSQSALLQNNPTGMTVGGAPAKLRIKVPHFDNSDLIKGYSRTMIGQCMNPELQDMKNLLYMLPRIWKMEERVTGTSLGLGRFRFQFENEEDILEVQKMEPFHFDYWMLSLVKWTPSTERNYPSAIKFWVRVTGLPLHYRDAEALKSVGRAIGINEEYEQIDTQGGRVQVILDGFKNLVFETVLEFHDGVEIDVTLQYERLFGYCKLCFSLRHDRNSCPRIQKEAGTRRDGQCEKGKEDAKYLSYKGVVRQVGSSSRTNGHSQTWKRKPFGSGTGNNEVQRDISRREEPDNSRTGVSKDQETRVHLEDAVTTADRASLAKDLGSGLTEVEQKLLNDYLGPKQGLDSTGLTDATVFTDGDELFPIKEETNEDTDLGNFDLDGLEFDLDEAKGLDVETSMDELLDSTELGFEDNAVITESDKQVSKEEGQQVHVKAKRVLFKANTMLPGVNLKKRTVQKILTPRKRAASRNGNKTGDGMHHGKTVGNGKTKDGTLPQEGNSNQLNG